MTDLQINIELARACGWLPSSQYAVMHGQYQVLRQILTCNKDGTLRKFDYRDPVIFVSICKQWNLRVGHHTKIPFAACSGNVYIGDTIEKAAATCVIDMAKRGAK